MAEQGFNICMIGRNQQKMADKLSAIASKYP
jgi:short-subunit dehydrogenase